MKIKILLPAESEISDGIEYYNKQYPGLGYEFANEIKISLNTIEQFPKAWPIYFDNFRKCIVRRFPYAIIYEIKNNFILVFGIMHMKTSPKSWKSRLVNDTL